jgi:integrase
MRVKLNTEFVRTLPRKNIDIYDSKYPGLVLRCRASGVHTYRVLYGRGKAVTLGRADTLTPDEARTKARDELSAIAKGHDPQAARKEAKAALTLRAFLDQHLEPWTVEHHKRGKETIQRLRSVFVDLLDYQVAEINSWTVEKWRTERLKQTKRPKPATVNSQVTMLKAALAKAVAWKLLAAHPIGKDVKRLKADRTGRIRYLSPAEEGRLRKALEARDAARCARREQANTWRRARGYAEWPEENADHLMPIVLVALNTGLRKGEIFNLRWHDVDFIGKQLTVQGEGETREEGAKSSQTRYVPLNAEVVQTLLNWNTNNGLHAAANGRVFPGRADSNDGRLDDVKKAWLPVVKAAKLATAFRFHDLRHTFASKLVMAGVDLNTVRELLGHADLKMTLRYAHLAPEHKAAAVAKLVAHGA